MITLVATGSYNLDDIQSIRFYQPNKDQWLAEICVRYIEETGNTTIKYVHFEMPENGLTKLLEVFPLISDSIKESFSVTQNTVAEIAPVKTEILLRDDIKSV